jgi:hypothetical protein
MWSAIYRQNRTILELSDTNMLVEAWHHVLKCKFLHGKRNRRIDFLLHALTKRVLPFYAAKWARRALGFEGDDLESQERRETLVCAWGIPSQSIQVRNLCSLCPPGSYSLLAYNRPGQIPCQVPVNTQ